MHAGAQVLRRCIWKAQEGRVGRTLASARNRSLNSRISGRHNVKEWRSEGVKEWRTEMGWNQRMSPGNHTSISSVLLTVVLPFPAYRIRPEMLLSPTPARNEIAHRNIYWPRGVCKASWSDSSSAKAIERNTGTNKSPHRKAREATPSMLLSSDQNLWPYAGQPQVNSQTCIPSEEMRMQMPTGFHALCNLLLTTSWRCMGEGGFHSAPSRCWRGNLNIYSLSP